MNAIIVPIANDPVSGEIRKAHHNILKIDADLEMSHSILIKHYHDQDTLMKDYIMSNANLSEDQRIRQLKKYEDIEVIASTRGAVVNPANGNHVDIDFEGWITELQYWQRIPAALFSNAQYCSEIIYGLIGISIQNMNIRNRF